MWLKLSSQGRVVLLLSCSGRLRHSHISKLRRWLLPVELPLLEWEARASSGTREWSRTKARIQTTRLPNQTHCMSFSGENNEYPYFLLLHTHTKTRGFLSIPKRATSFCVHLLDCCYSFIRKSPPEPDTALALSKLGFNCHVTKKRHRHDE